VMLRVSKDVKNAASSLSRSAFLTLLRSIKHEWHFRFAGAITEPVHGLAIFV